MRVIPPIVITPAMLTSTNAPEPGVGETVWTSGTFAAGDQRIVVSTHRKYQCVTAGSRTISPNLDPTNWVDLGPTNAWAMFDLKRNAQTVLASPLVVAIALGQRIDSFALTGLESSRVRAVLSVGATVYMDTTIQTSPRNTVDWLSYLTGAFTYRPTVVQFNVPPVTGATLTVTITGSNVKCSGLVVGRSVYLGKMQVGAVSGALNYSKITRDDFGNAAMVPRRSVPTTTQKLLLPKSSVNLVDTTRTALNAVSALWCGRDAETTDGYFDVLTIMGPYKQFDIGLDHPDYAVVTLQLEEI